MEAMYDPSNRRIGMRDADDNVAMFAFYIWNNVKIGFQTFAGGLAFGLGSIFFLVFNGVTIGAVAAHVTNVGFGATFWSFVSGHSAMELTAIALSGAAGLRLGGAVIAPGTALAQGRAGRGGAPRGAHDDRRGDRCSPSRRSSRASGRRCAACRPTLKYGVGIAMWALVVAYFVLAGRGRAR